MSKNVKIMSTGFQPSVKHIYFGRPEYSKDFYHIQASNETGLTISPGCDVIKTENTIVCIKPTEQRYFSKTWKDIKSFFKVRSHAPSWQNHLQGEQLQFTWIQTFGANLDDIVKTLIS